jgi:NAD+ synthase|nr:MAG TPA: NAD synthase [Caudoviricetes sp.]
MRKYEFDAAKTKDEIITWIRNYFRKNGPDCNAVIGISGGKDSSIVAALCCEALGNGRVIGVLMPQGVQEDIDVARELVAHLGIKSFEINIAETVNTLLANGRAAGLCDSKQARVNLPARIRMATLFMVSQSTNGRVANTCNASENFVGWQTVGGDGFGQFSPLSKLTVTEVKSVGRELGLPEKFIEKAPADGLTGKTDEDNFGFTYEFLDKYIRTGEFGGDTATAAKIDRMHEANLFKDLPMPTYDPSLFNWWG